MITLVLVLGVTLGWLARQLEVRALTTAATRAEVRADEATDRLVQAWRDGYHVPEPDAEPIEEDPLPAELLDIVTSYPDPQASAKVEAAIRRKLNSGRTADAICMDHETGAL